MKIYSPPLSTPDGNGSPEGFSEPKLLLWQGGRQIAIGAELQRPQKTFRLKCTAGNGPQTIIALLFHNLIF
jgi:hypothetical protein